MKFLFTAAALLLLMNMHAAAQQNPTLTAAYDGDKNIVKLRWQHPAGDHITSYAVQRSSDNTFFTDLVSQTASGVQDGELLKFNDEKIAPGKNYYRLKIFRGNKSYETTVPVMVLSGTPGGSWVIYPVPVTSVINLQYNGTEPVEGVIYVTIQCVTSGLYFNRLRLASNTRYVRIPVDNIGRGIYDIRVYVQDKVVWNQRFVK